MSLCARGRERELALGSFKRSSVEGLGVLASGTFTSSSHMDDTGGGGEWLSRLLRIRPAGTGAQELRRLLRPLPPSSPRPPPAAGDGGGQYLV